MYNLPDAEAGLVLFASVAADSSMHGRIVAGDALLLIDGAPVREG